ncbi:MAG: TRAP transporter substrate-binding protein [Sedimentisphaerales bacterium]|nr:TRAP transporter substrate-binding protein [Sedimentisphaerales bacterium]
MILGFISPRARLGVLLLLTAVLAAGCTRKADAEADTGAGAAKPRLVFRLANELKPDSKIWDASRLFKEEVEQASPDGTIKAGEIKVVFYDQGMVGTERQLLETCYFGVIEMIQINSSVVTTVDPAYSMLDLPYLFLSEEHHKEVLYGEIGNKFLQRLEDKGLLGLGFYGTGFRNLFYKQDAGKPPAETPEDLRGLKIRVMESPIMIASINAMGASATPVPFSELFQGLKTGVVDGAENSARIFVSYKYYETGCNCFTLTEHFANQHIIIANADWLASLEPKYQKRIKEVARIIIPRFDAVWDETTRNSIEEMRQLGVTVNRIPDKRLFIERANAIIESYPRQYPDVPLDLLAEIRELGKAYMN